MVLASFMGLPKQSFWVITLWWSEISPSVHWRLFLMLYTREKYMLQHSKQTRGKLPATVALPSTTNITMHVPALNTVLDMAEPQQHKDN